MKYKIEHKNSIDDLYLFPFYLALKNAWAWSVQLGLSPLCK